MGVTARIAHVSFVYVVLLRNMFREFGFDNLLVGKGAADFDLIQP